MTSLSEEGRALPGDDQAVKAAIEHWQRAEKWKAKALSAQQRLEQAVEVLQRLYECVDPVLPLEGYYETLKVPIPEDQFGNTEATTISTIISVKTRTKDIRALRAATNNARNFLATLDDNAPEQERE